ncbi:WD40 repeat domain-containing protein [Aspergillus affinis]|uniref:WD40 repeat domain-containing protein n=1 Tax=Aspergillus affinis TaxID=1070780 RepID=UPI0022FED572|nr:cell cycle regulatory protein [Aspergillus affinis]KAI9038921.1 cell cycle regulatory protein [Aspergillus affinis]
MILSGCRSLRTPDSSSDGSLSPPELFSGTSEDDESEASFDLAFTPLPLTRHHVRSKEYIRTKLPYLFDLNIEKPISPPPTEINERQTVDNSQHSPMDRLQSAFTVQTPTRKQQTKSKRGAVASTAARSQNGPGPVSPDRFIPDREFINSPSSPFRVGKAPQELSSEEKVLRHRLPGEDPFMPARRRNLISKRRIVSGRMNTTRYGPHLVNDPAIMPTGRHHGSATTSPRQVSNGAVWQVGGNSAAVGQQPIADFARSRVVLASRSNAPIYSARFIPHLASSEDRKKFESRVALALDIDPTTRLLKQSEPWPFLGSTRSPFTWKDNVWTKAGRENWTIGASTKGKARVVPTRPFRILDAPFLRDDFYCTTLAYSSTTGALAVGLNHRVYLWSEAYGVQNPPLGPQHPSNYVTSLAFSSENGGRSILAVGRHSGALCLWSTYDREARFELSQPDMITCVAFKQTKTRRLSERFRNYEVDTEDLAVGDDAGNIWYYSVEWSDDQTRAHYHWPGTMVLIAKIAAHTQQVCGINWSPDGNIMATGGNDNVCLIFELHDIIPARDLGVTADIPGVFPSSASDVSQHLLVRYPLVSHLPPIWAYSHQSESLSASLLVFVGSVIHGGTRTTSVGPNRQKHRLAHSAAVKAIAFAPWQSSLLATGGGSNDRAIHFYHVPSGACLATINVFAQVTSLIWSQTRQELAATFGFAQPEHPFRIAVFAWPSCEQIAAIPWGPYGSSWDGPENGTHGDCGRALCAVSYPGRPPPRAFGGLEHSRDSSASKGQGLRPKRRTRNARRTHTAQRAAVRPRAKEGGLWCSRTMNEGCIIVASSDESVKFHEVWSNSTKRQTAVLEPNGGGIFDGLEGLEKPGSEIIR